jgi:hypothetical protein
MEPHLRPVPSDLAPSPPPRAYLRWARVQARYTAAAVVAAALTVWLAAAGAWPPALLAGVVMVGWLVGRQRAQQQRGLALGVWLKLTELDR